MSVITSIAMMLLLQTAPSQPVTDGASHTVTIVGVGGRPPFGSGYIKTSVLVLARDDDGDVRSYFMIYSGEGQVLPALGSRCTFTSRPGRLEMVGGMDIAPFLIGEEFETFECGPSPTFEELIQSEWRRHPD